MKSTEKRLQQNILSVVDWLQGTTKAKHIVLYGRSLGSGPSIYAASTRKVSGLIIQSGFLSVITTRLPIRIPYFDVFLNEDVIAACPCPSLFIHGTKDSVVPFEHGHKLSRLASHLWGTCWLHGAGHNNIDNNDHYRDEMMQSIQHFLSFIDPTSSPSLYINHGLHLRRRIR
jgi:fermentation-respiration switch protein FrsA (DUF1100 family)